MTYCENCGGKWGDAVKVVNNMSLCEDCAFAEEELNND